MIYSSLLSIHIIAGFLSLILFWAPLFTRKGSDWHKRIGKIYIQLMWLVVLTAGCLSIHNWINDQFSSAILLGFLTLLTANPLWYGIAILKYKKGKTNGFRKKHLLFEVVVFLSALFLIAYGGYYLKGQGMGILMVIFGIIGISNIRNILAHIKSSPQKTNWLKEHINGMIITGIAAYTAFFAFGGRNLLGDIFSGYWMIVPWILPTVIGVIAMPYFGRNHKQSTL